MRSFSNEKSRFTYYLLEKSSKWEHCKKEEKKLFAVHQNDIDG